MNQTEFARLLLPLKQKIYCFALSIVGNSDEAEDVTQDLYEKLWQRRDSLDGLNNIEGFVMSSVRNLSIDHIRSRRLHRDKLAEVKSDQRNASWPSETFDMVEIVSRVIGSLPERQRQVIHLRDVEGYEIEQIATIMELEQTNVRVILSRARRLVKEQIIEITSYGIKNDR